MNVRFCRNRAFSRSASLKSARGTHSVRRMLLCIALFASSPLALLANPDESPAADLLLMSEHVITMAHTRPVPAEALAVAVRDGRITWIGAPDQAEDLVGPNTQVVDLGNAALLPGFIDAHGHASFVAVSTQLANVASPPVGPAQNMADVQSTLRAYIRERAIAPGEWVVGRGYDDSLLAEQRHPNRDDLDAVSTEHPIVLLHVSGHLAAANSRALARGGITADSPNPAGGIIRRRTDSAEPNGVLEETATYPLRQYMNAPVTDPVASVAAAMDIYTSHGITTAQDGAASAEIVTLLRAADQAGPLPIDVVVYPMGQAGIDSVRDAFEFGEYRGRVKVGGVKLMLDGSPQGKTAYMTEPYKIPPPGQATDYRGYPNIPQDRVDALVSDYLQAGIPVIAHANGDAAADMLINAVRSAATRADHRTVMIHAQTVREDQLVQMKNLRMIPSYFSAHTFYWGDWHRDSVFGEARANRISPTASTVARHMPFTVHNDAPIVPPDMIRLLWATTNRLTRSGQVLGANQRISTWHALRAMTLHAAYQHFEDTTKGSLEVGKQADFVVLSANPLATPPADLLDINVVATYARGKVVFERSGL